MNARERFVAISCFQGELNGFVAGRQDAIVAVDVIRSTTTAVTAVALGRRCFPVPSLEAAARLQSRLERPLLVGELGGYMPHGFHLTNSPSAIAQHDDISQPMILLSSSGTKLVCSARGNVYLGCLRNYGALVNYLADHHEHVTVVGAGTRGEFREEDALCCAWIAAALLERGYAAKDARTQDVIDQWATQPAEAFVGGKSTEYLRETDQLEDLEFILAHVDDLNSVPYLSSDEVTELNLNLALHDDTIAIADDH